MYSHVTHLTHVTHRPHKGRRPYPQYPKSEAYPRVPNNTEIFRLRSAPLNMTQRGYRCFDSANAPLNMTKWVAREGSGGVVKSSEG